MVFYRELTIVLLSWEYETHGNPGIAALRRELWASGPLNSATSESLVNVNSMRRYFAVQDPVSVVSSDYFTSPVSEDTSMTG